MSKKSAPVRELRDLLHELLPDHSAYRGVVRPEAQTGKMDLLRDSLSPESFYFVFNLLTCELEQVNGVDQALGYSEREFTVGQYLDVVHPGQAIQFNLIAQSMYKVLCKGVFKLHFITNSYISLVALRHYNGEYFVFKKTTSVFQFDHQNRLLSQLNEFMRIDSYENSPLKPRILESSGLQKEEFERQVFKMVFQNFAEKKYFSRRQLEVLTLYAGEESLTTKDLAARLGVKVSSINTYNKRILVKAKEIFSHPFTEAREVALYLKKEKIL